MRGFFPTSAACVKCPPPQDRSPSLDLWFREKRLAGQPPPLRRAQTLKSPPNRAFYEFSLRAVKCNRCRRGVVGFHLCGLVQQEMQRRLLTVNLKVDYPKNRCASSFRQTTHSDTVCRKLSRERTSLETTQGFVKVLPVHLEAPQSRCLRVFDGFHSQPP
jgi:hypothetical protein